MPRPDPDDLNDLRNGQSPLLLTTPLDRLKPLVAPVVGRIFQYDGSEMDVLQPEETEAVTPPALLPGMLDRVTGTDEHATLSLMLESARTTVVTHAPVIRRVYRKAIVRRSGFATWSKSERYASELRASELVGPLMHVPVLRCCLNYVSWRYFGHWLMDAVPAALIEPETGMPWLPPESSWGHARDYLNIFDISSLEAPLVHADRLIVYQDFSQGSHKRTRYRRLRDMVHDRFGGADATDRVYIRRGATGARRQITNEPELLEQLAARGWKIIDVATASAEALQRCLCKARCVVGIEGSHLNHAYFSLPAGSSMVILTPGDRFTTTQLGRCNANRISNGMVILNGTEKDGYRIDMDDLWRTIDLTAARG